MKKFVLICFCVLSSVGGYAQNWDINTLHKINSLDSKFARNYSKAFSKSAPYICLLYTSPSPRDRSLSRMPSSA